MAKNKKIYIIIGALVLLLAIVGGAFFLATNNTSLTPEPTEQSQEAPVKAIKPEDIGLTLKAGSKANSIVLSVTKLDGVKSVEYEVTYDAQETTEGETAVVPKGVTNSPIEVKPSDQEITREIYLGTCSRNVCRPDDVKSDIKFLFKVTFKDGSVGSLEQTFSKSSL